MIMFLNQKFNNPHLNLTLELFLRMLQDQLGDELVSVVLYGSVVFDDLSPGYSDLDFLAVVENDLSEQMCEQLIYLRRPLRSGDYGIYATMIEGAFLPRAMLDPSVHGKAFWWGTGGERRWDENKLGWLVSEFIRRQGIIIWGEDIRSSIPKATDADLIEDVQSFCRTLQEHGRGGGLHSVDWLLTAARELLLLREGRFSSKSEAADWGYLNAHGSWREYLPKAKHIRLNPATAESPDVRHWLDGISAPIMEACDELEKELENRR
jgi:hypothetical protein